MNCMLPLIGLFRSAVFIAFVIFKQFFKLVWYYEVAKVCVYEMKELFIRAFGPLQSSVCSGKH